MRFITRRMIPHPHLSIQRGAALCLEHPPVKDPTALPAKHLLVEKLGDSSQLPFGDLKPQTQDMIADYCLEFLQNMNHSDTRKSTQAFLDRFRGFTRCAECDGTSSPTPQWIGHRVLPERVRRGELTSRWRLVWYRRIRHIV